jgi:hypothetical protein
VQKYVYRVVPSSMSNGSIRSAPLRHTLNACEGRGGYTSEYFNCANSSSCTVSESVMCIKPSAERCLLLEGFVFVFRLFLSLHLLLFRLVFLLEGVHVKRRWLILFCCLQHSDLSFICLVFFVVYSCSFLKLSFIKPFPVSLMTRFY